MKTCTLCKIEKHLQEYKAAPHRKDGVSCWCRCCALLKKKEYYKKHKVKILAKQKIYKEANPEKVKLAKKRSTEAKKEEYAGRKKEWRLRHAERLSVKSVEYRAENREMLNLKQRARYLANKEKYIKQAAEYYGRRYKSDPIFVLSGLCRRRIILALGVKKFAKNSTTATLLGCSAKYLKEYLEAKFLPGMTWANRGVQGWHIDHCLPLASGSTREEIEALCHYTNLQPMWASDNLKKGAKMPHEIIAQRASTWAIKSRLT